MLTYSLLKPPTPRQHLLSRWYTFVASIMHSNWAAYLKMDTYKNNS